MCAGEPPPLALRAHKNTKMSFAVTASAKSNVAFYALSRYSVVLRGRAASVGVFVSAIVLCVGNTAA